MAPLYFMPDAANPNAVPAPSEPRMLGSGEEIGKLPPFECSYPECHLRFHTLKDMRRHKKYSSEHDYCRRCDVDCMDWEELLKHKVDLMTLWLYELIGVVRPNKPVTEIKEIARATGSLVLQAGGVVRGITNWGTFLLPKPARKQGAVYHSGHYFIMRFDSSAKTQHTVRRTLGLDPRLIRYSIVNMGSKLSEIAEVKGKAEWPHATQSGSAKR